jgi:hypothetical protein
LVGEALGLGDGFGHHLLELRIALLVGSRGARREQHESAEHRSSERNEHRGGAAA